jgi:hypothetical protein
LRGVVYRLPREPPVSNHAGVLFELLRGFLGHQICVSNSARCPLIAPLHRASGGSE